MRPDLSYKNLFRFDDYRRENSSFFLMGNWDEKKKLFRTKLINKEKYRFNLFHQLRIFEPCTINQLNLEIKYKWTEIKFCLFSNDKFDAICYYSSNFVEIRLNFQLQLWEHVTSLCAIVNLKIRNEGGSGVSRALFPLRMLSSGEILNIWYCKFFAFDAWIEKENISCYTV